MKKWLVMIVVLSFILIGMITYTACNYEETPTPKEEVKDYVLETYTSLNTESPVVAVFVEEEKAIESEEYETAYIYLITIVNEKAETTKYIASWVDGELWKKQID